MIVSRFIVCCSQFQVFKLDKVELSFHELQIHICTTYQFSPLLLLQLLGHWSNTAYPAHRVSLHLLLKLRHLRLQLRLERSHTLHTPHAATKQLNC